MSAVKSPQPEIYGGRQAASHALQLSTKKTSAISQEEVVRNCGDNILTAPGRRKSRRWEAAEGDSVRGRKVTDCLYELGLGGLYKDGWTDREG